MKLEKEITVKVTCDYETLHKTLIENNFEIKEKYTVKDNYMIHSDLDLSKLSKLDILKQCVLVRDIVDIKKVLLYKYKKYAKNGDILEQGKVECPIQDIDKAIKFMEAINYKTLFKIYDTCIVYANEDTELNIQLVNDEYIFIEMEGEPEYVDTKYNSIDDMKNALNKLGLLYDNSNYFVKKAELTLDEIL